MEQNQLDNERIGGVLLDYTDYDGADVYNEGDDEEEFVLETLRTHKDPEEVLRRDNRWPVLYQLSPIRRTIVLPMDLHKTDSVLEIGAGMGAITGAMAQRCAQVDCVELSRRRCLANAYRNQQYDNIQILVGNFEKVHLEPGYDVVTLIGVLEYAGFYIHGAENPAKAMLRRIWELMKPGGRLYIAIENRLGMKYFAGCQEDHLGRPYIGIEGYTQADGVRTFSKGEITDLLTESGFGQLYFYYPYPDYKLPNVIYSDDMLCGEFLPEVVNMDAPRLRVFDERRAMESMKDTAEFAIFANSFLIEAVKP